jgi:transposase
MEDRLIMNKKERQRKALLDQVIAGFISKKDARKRLALGDRQFRRIFAAYKANGDKALVHKSRGKTSTRAYPAEKKEKILSIYREKYLDFGPTFASEKLEEEDQLKVHAETLRLWLKAEGLWLPRRSRKTHRKQRTRRARFGELLQLDGSIHAWFEGMDKKQCLMNMVDDATGKTLAILDEGETTRAAFALLKWWIQEAGIPLAIYVDLKSLYVSPKSLRHEEEGELVEPEWLTHFSKACKKLGIEIIKAYSPQAKGRVERNHAVYQDRFVKELKLKKITTIEKANAILSGGFVNKLNAKFAKEPASPEDAHIPLRKENNLDDILCWESTREVKNDWTIQFENKHYQIEKKARVQPKQKVTVKQHLDGSISLWAKESKIPFLLIERPVAVAKKKQEIDCVARSKKATQNRHKTPWNQFIPGWFEPCKPNPQRNGTLNLRALK